MSEVKTNEELLTELNECKAERAVLKKSVIEIMNLMGLIDPATGKMREEVATGEESFMPGMLKALGDTITLLTKASAPEWMGGLKYKEQLAAKFAFIAPLLPIINKYNNEPTDTKPEIKKLT
ncbi:MAG: hypothetical protein H0U95_01135 [Bacteroidetes bacterium]|nr:hypothetical protein [Bacteroidota bacterium]